MLWMTHSPKKYISTLATNAVSSTCDTACDKALLTYSEAQKREKRNGVGAEPPAQRSLWGLYDLLHGVATSGLCDSTSRKMEEINSCQVVAVGLSLDLVVIKRATGSFAIKLP
jgi:hypothetical protein